MNPAGYGFFLLLFDVIRLRFVRLSAIHFAPGHLGSAYTYILQLLWNYNPNYLYIASSVLFHGHLRLRHK